MARDYAKKKKPKRRKQPALFHLPSIGLGALMGAVFVLLVSNTEFLFNQPDSQQTASSANTKEEPFSFEFHQRLSDAEIKVPESTLIGVTESKPTVIMEYLLQAGSFRSLEDAEALRAKLLLVNLPANSQEVTLADGPWYRVMVGPFSKKVDTQRAMTQLREQNIGALWMERPAS